MNLDDFKKMLMTEPDSRDPEFLAARRESTEHMAAARDSEDFESQLAAALRVTVQPDLAETILERALPESETPRNWRWLAVAATVTLAVGISVVLFQRSGEDLSLREAFVQHLLHPEPSALASRDTISVDDLQQAFSRFGADLDTDVGHVTYLQRCRIGGRRGLHMVVTHNGDQVTVMYLPKEALAKAEDFFVGEVTGRMVATPTGVLALFGHQGQDMDELSARFLRGLGAFSVAALGS